MEIFNVRKLIIRRMIISCNNCIAKLKEIVFYELYVVNCDTLSSVKGVEENETLKHGVYRTDR